LALPFIGVLVGGVIGAGAYARRHPEEVRPDDGVSTR
jgi:hypothetical protein